MSEPTPTPGPSGSVLPGLKGYNPDTLQPWTVSVVTSMTVLQVVAVALRLLSRRLKRQQLWWDDWLVIFAMFWNFVVVGFIFGMYDAGMGIHADLLDPNDIVRMAKYLVVAEVLYVYNLVWTKLSILLMYYRIFHFDYFRKWAYGIGIFIVAWVICITFLFIFICVPVEKLWYPALPGHCINQVGTWIANAASTIISDLVILILPIPQVWSLQLRTTEKIAVTVAFSLGFFVVFASAYRFSVLFSYTATDPSYTLAPTVGWTQIEMSAGIVSACLPILRPVILLLGKSLGLKGSMFRSDIHTSTTGMSKTGGGGGGRGTNLVSVSGIRTRTDVEIKSDATGNKEQGPFYRLPDENVSGQTTGKLRPELGPEHGYEYTITTNGGQSRSRGTDTGSLSSGDEIPLQGIRVEKDFKHSSSVS